VYKRNHAESLAKRLYETQGWSESLGCNYLESREGGAMKNVVLKMSVSIDGFVGGRNAEIDWTFRSMDAGVMVWLSETLGNAKKSSFQEAI
jgi:hypothetical protein